MDILGDIFPWQTNKTKVFLVKVTEGFLKVSDYSVTQASIGRTPSPPPVRLTKPDERGRECVLWARGYTCLPAKICMGPENMGYINSSNRGPR